MGQDDLDVTIRPDRTWSLERWSSLTATEFYQAEADSYNCPTATLGNSTTRVFPVLLQNVNNSFFDLLLLYDNKFPGLPITT